MQQKLTRANTHIHFTIKNADGKIEDIVTMHGMIYITTKVDYIQVIFTQSG